MLTIKIISYISNYFGWNLNFQFPKILMYIKFYKNSILTKKNKKEEKLRIKI